MKLRKLLLAGAALAVATGVPAQASIVDNPHFKVLGLVIVWGADASGGAPIASDFVIDTGTGATAAASGDADLIAGDVHTVVTGSLTPTPNSLAGANPFDVTGAVSGGVFTDDGNGFLDAADSYTAFELDGSTDVSVSGASFDSSFYVASNTPFAIDAQATAVAANTSGFTLSDVGYALSVTQTATDGALTFGGNAQLPHSGNTSTSGVVGTVADLSDMSSAVNVFTGDRRTAASVGSIVDQSVRFDAVYSLGGAAGYDLSMGAGEIEADVVYTVFVP